MLRCSTKAFVVLAAAFTVVSCSTVWAPCLECAPSHP